jgi:parallel beta-helix repeat protein
MKRKILLTIFLILAFVSALRIQPAKATDIHVPYDYATIQEAINAANTGDHVYVSGTYHEHITINKTISLIGETEAIIDGDNIGTVINVEVNGVTIQNFKIFNAGSDWGNRDSGIKMEGRSNCYIANNWINNSRIGIYLHQCSNIHVLENTITHCIDALSANYSPYSTIQSNTIQNNDAGVFLNGIDTKLCLVKSNLITNGSNGIHLQYWASNNTIINNWVIDNTVHGIGLSQSQNNTIYHNNFIDNVEQAWITPSSTYNKWDVGWSVGGNFWSDHNLKDDSNGEYQNQLGSDGICDSPYTVYESDMDIYPLAASINIYDVPLGFITEKVDIISNSTISHFQMNTTAKTMKFNVTGEIGIGFCRVDIPNAIAAVWQDNYTVLVDGEPPTYLRNWTHGTVTYIYFKYQHSEQEVIIISEHQSFLILLASMMATLLTVIVGKNFSLGHRKKGLFLVRI